MEFYLDTDEYLEEQKQQVFTLFKKNYEVATLYMQTFEHLRLFYANDLTIHEDEIKKETGKRNITLFSARCLSVCGNLRNNFMKYLNMFQIWRSSGICVLSIKDKWTSLMLSKIRIHWELVIYNSKI